MLLSHAAGLVKRKGLKRQGSSSPEVLKVFLGSTGFRRGASGEVWGWRSTEGPRGQGLAVQVPGFKESKFWKPQWPQSSAANQGMDFRVIWR